jgi:hypothetical protein
MILAILGCATAPSTSGVPTSPTTPTSPTPPTFIGDTGGACVDPATVTPAEECTFAQSDWLVLGAPSVAHGCSLGKIGRFTAFDPQSPAVFVPSDGSAPLELVAYGTPGAWADLPDLVGAGEVVLYVAGSCGDYGCPALTAVTDLAGVLLMVVGNTLGTVAGWTAQLGASAGSCPQLPPSYDFACQECQANVPLHVVGPGFDAEAWQSERVVDGDYTLTVGTAFQGGGQQLCVDGPSMNVYQWYVVRTP